jgi:hypothetical protein
VGDAGNDSERPDGDGGGGQGNGGAGGDGGSPTSNGSKDAENGSSAGRAKGSGGTNGSPCPSQGTTLLPTSNLSLQHAFSLTPRSDKENFDPQAKT